MGAFCSLSSALFWRSGSPGVGGVYGKRRNASMKVRQPRCLVQALIMAPAEHRANPYRKHRDMSAPSLSPSSDAYTSPHTLVNSHVPTASYQSSSEPLSSTPPLSVIQIPAPQRAWDTLAPLPASSVLDSSDAQSAITTADASLIGSSFSPRTPPPMYVERG